MWSEAAADVAAFNKAYGRIRGPKDVLAALKVADKAMGLAQWARKCLTAAHFGDLLAGWRAVGKAVKDRGASDEAKQEALDHFSAAISEAIGRAAPKGFVYQGLMVDNPERVDDELARHALSGLDVMRAFFRRRGVDPVVLKDIQRVVLGVNIDASAFFNSETRELVLDVVALAKESKGRFTDTFVGETVIHEIGHYLHRVYIKGEAEQAWNEPWKDLGSLARPGARPEPNRNETLDPLGIPTDYGKVDKYEDFAETFMLFMVSPERLSPTATYRMQRALSLSGLYGKPVMRLVARYLNSELLG